jgi:ubiquitin carboxyl-terminal hydrolase 14
VDTLFGIALEKELKCKETDTEPPVQQREFHRKIVCNIEGGAGKSVQINHIHEGIRYVCTQVLCFAVLLLYLMFVATVRAWRAS